MRTSQTHHAEREARSGKALSPELVVKFLITFVAIALILIRKKIPEIEFDNIDAVLIVLAALPWFISNIRSLKLPGGVEIELGELRKEQKAQQLRIDELNKLEQERQRKELDLLKSLVVNTTIPEHGIRHLRNLLATERVPYEPADAVSAELRRLLESGLIERRPGKGIRTLMRDRGDIKAHFVITDLGRNLLSAWDEVNTERSKGEDEA